MTFNYISHKFTLPYYPLVLSGFNIKYNIQTLSTKYRNDNSCKYRKSNTVNPEETVTSRDGRNVICFYVGDKSIQYQSKISQENNDHLIELGFCFTFKVLEHET